MKMEKINEQEVDGIEKMLNGGGVGGGSLKTMLKPSTKSSSSGTMINGTIHEGLEAHMNPCNYLMVDELGVTGNPVMPTGGDLDGGDSGGQFSTKQKLQTGSTQNGTGNLIQIPIPMHHRSSRSIRSLKRPQPQPHICILDKTVDNLDVYINVLSWTRIVKPEKTNDPIPLYGGMRVISGSATFKPLLIYAVTVNPIVLENTKRLCGNSTAQQSLMTLMVDFVEAMNPDLKLKRHPKILIDRDLTGELKEIWLALHSKRERDKFRVLEESYYLYEEFGPPAPGATTTSPTTCTMNECDEQADENETAGEGQVPTTDNLGAQSDISKSSSSQDKIDHKRINSDSCSTSSVPFTKKSITKGNECDNKPQFTNDKKSPVGESSVSCTSLKGSSSSSSSTGTKIKSPSDDVPPSPQTTVIQNTKNRTSHIPILGIKDNKEHNKESKEKKDKSGGDQSPIQRSIDFLAGISFFKSKNHETGGSGGSSGNGASAGSANSNNSNNSADNNKSNSGNSKRKDKNSNNSSSNSKTSSKQQHGVRNSNSNENSNTGRNDKTNSSSSNSNSNDDGGE